MFSKKATKTGKIFTADLALCSKCQISGEEFVNFRWSLYWCSFLSNGPFKYYVIIFLTFLGPPTYLFDDLQYCKSSKIAIFRPHPPTSLLMFTWMVSYTLVTLLAWLFSKESHVLFYFGAVIHDVISFSNHFNPPSHTISCTWNIKCLSNVCVHNTKKP